LLRMSPTPDELLKDLLRLAERLQEPSEAELTLRELSLEQSQSLLRLDRLLGTLLASAPRDPPRAESAERRELLHELEHAAERGELLLHYQPQVDLSSGRVVAAEALIRWQHPRLGLVPPVRFIPLAEESGLIVPIGNWVLRTACAQAQAWRRQGLDLRVAVNLSARQFGLDDLAATVAGALQASGLDPGRLELELTESCIVEDAKAAALQLGAIAALGTPIALDDFGTGYSSLSLLNRFSISVLKIDQSFVRGITGDPYAAALVSAINAMAHSLGMKSVAEGVETPEQLALLKGCGCDMVQGYLLARPAAPEMLDLRHVYT